MNKLKRIQLADCTKIGLGVARPEDVAISRTGDVWLSDQQSACAKLLENNGLVRTGRAGGAPNGISFDLSGKIVIANFGGPETGEGPLQRLDPESGEVETLCDELGGRKLFGCNYPLVDTKGTIWCSHSTWGPIDDAMAGQDDGIIFRWSEDGSCEVVATDIKFANGIAMDYEEQNLFVCETTGCDVLRYPIHEDGSLGQAERYGPSLGLSVSDVEGQRPLSPEVRGQLGVTDGCGFDAEGNLWVTLVWANRIVAITPNGQVVTILSDPTGEVMRNPTNVTWGGKDLMDLYIGSISTDYVLKVRSPIPGMPLAHQRV